MSASLFSSTGGEFLPAEYAPARPTRRARSSGGLPNFGRGYDVSDAELDARLLRYFRIGRLCQPRRGHCEVRAATRCLIVEPIDLDTGKAIGPREDVLVCSVHTGNWTGWRRCRVLGEPEPLPKQQVARRSLGPSASVIEGHYPCTPAGGICPNSPTRHLVLVERHPDSGRQRLGAQEFYATVCGGCESTWNDEPRALVLERGDLTEKDLVA